MKKKLTACACLTALATSTIYFINRTINYLSTMDNLLPTTEGTYYKWRFGNIFYKKQGSGTPILLIHDLSSHSSGYEWKKVASILSATNTVYVVDLLGCGRSEKPNLTYTNYLYVQLVNDFIRNVIGEKTDIIATGESGSFAAMACAAGNDLIGKIAMVNPKNLKELSTVPSNRTKSLKCLLQLPLIGTLLYNILQSKEGIKEVFEYYYYYDSSKIDQRTMDIYSEAAHLDRGHSKYLFASIKGRYTKVNLLNCPTPINHSIFILSGEYLPGQEETVAQYKHYLPAIESTIIPDTKYLPQLECPENFCEQIQIYFSEDI